MTSRIRIALILATALGLIGCSGGGCHDGFGSTSCSSSSSGGSGSFGGGGGGGGSSTAPTAYAYAVDESGTIDGYVLDPTAKTFQAISGYAAPTIATNNGGVGMAVAQGKYLYAGIAAAGELYAWTIGSDGMLTAVSDSPYTATFLADYITGVGQDNIITNPQGTLLFISDALHGEIYVYAIGSGGALTAVSGSPFALPTGFEPMNLATDGLGKYLYVVDGDYSTHQGSKIAGYAIGTGTSLGVLTAVTGSPFSGTGFNMWQLAGEPAGQFMIGTTGSSKYNGVSDDDNLYVFSIEQTGTAAGVIAQVTGSPSATANSPLSIAVQPSTGGNLVYSLGINDGGTAFNPIEGFEISSTGTLTKDTGSPFSNIGEGTWAQFDLSGSYLMVYASYTDQSTNETVTQLAPLEVGTGGALTQPISTLTIATPGFWVVVDKP
jgi:hypothetical protein